VTTPGDVASVRLSDLRAEFDTSFATPPRHHEAKYDELLAIRAGQRRYVLRLAQTSGLYRDRPVTPLPGPVPALLGVAGFSGTIVPVYDLGTLLRYPAPEVPRWLVVAAGTPPVALAFHDLDGHLRVPTESIVGESGRDGLPGCLGGMVTLPDDTRPIVDIPAVRAAVLALTGKAPSGP
jgi:chemotaxis signal transduction protein